MNIKQIDFTHVQINDALLKQRIETVKNSSIRVGLDKCYDTERINNFIKAGKRNKGEHPEPFIGIVYDDADLYKILEGAAYVLHQSYDEALHNEVKQLIQMISEAQEPSGYLTTKHTVNNEGHWANFDAHEMYNMGHMIEAACAYTLATKEYDFLNIAIKAANYLCDTFGENKKDWLPGHQEIELALVRLFELTNDQKYITLSKYLLSRRGKNIGKINLNYTDRAVKIKGQDLTWNKSYHQDTVPLEKITKVEGHAVRAMYMYSAMTALDLLDETSYFSGLESVWNNLVNKNMYLTGGIGSTKEIEGFTFDYDLPNYSAYCETCASVGMVYWNSKMFQLTGDKKYMDVVVLEIYNGILSGLSSEGTRFFYDNPLGSKGDVVRSEWFDTSCCPTQLMRFIPSIGNYFYAETKHELYLNILASNQLTIEGATIHVIREGNNVTLTCQGDRYQYINIRIPNNNIKLLNVSEYSVHKGYLRLKIQTEMKLSLYEPITLLSSHPEVTENIGTKALYHNEFIYCAEFNIENKSAIYYCDHQIKIICPEQIDGISFDSIKIHDATGHYLFKLIPYFLWNNCGKQAMAVWLPFKQSEHLYF